MDQRVKVDLQVQIRMLDFFQFLGLVKTLLDLLHHLIPDWVLDLLWKRDGFAASMAEHLKVYLHICRRVEHRGCFPVISAWIVLLGLACHGWLGRSRPLYFLCGLLMIFCLPVRWFEFFMGRTASYRGLLLHRFWSSVLLWSLGILPFLELLTKIFEELFFWVFNHLLTVNLRVR
jgi:hypothetical protein